MNFKCDNLTVNFVDDWGAWAFMAFEPLLVATQWLYCGVRRCRRRRRLYIDLDLG